MTTPLCSLSYLLFMQLTAIWFPISNSVLQGGTRPDPKPSGLRGQVWHRGAKGMSFGKSWGPVAGESRVQSHENKRKRVHQDEAGLGLEAEGEASVRAGSHPSSYSKFIWLFFKDIESFKFYLIKWVLVVCAFQGMSPFHLDCWV